MAATQFEDVSICLCTPLPPLPVTTSQEQYWMEECLMSSDIAATDLYSHQSSPSDPAVNLCHHLQVISLRLRLKKIQGKVSYLQKLVPLRDKEHLMSTSRDGSSFESSCTVSSWQNKKRSLWTSSCGGQKIKEASWVAYNHIPCVVSSGCKQLLLLGCTKRGNAVINHVW